jgi:arsenic resistance protein ArsH
MKPSAYYDRIVDVIEELVRFTILLRPNAEQLVDRYSERKDRNEPVLTPVEKAGLAAT